MTHRQQHDQQEEQAIREQRNRDIDRYGYERAFRRGRQVSYEKYEWMKENNKLRGEM